MELRHIRYFIAVGRCLSFTKAAEMLHVSQPPLSRQIQEFEEEVGVALFDRTGRKTTLTEAGEYLLVEAERLLEGIESACRNAKTIAEGSRALNIGCVNFFFNTTLTPFIEEIRRIIPIMRMELRVMSTESQERALLSGAIDVGFVRSWIHDAELVFEPIAQESLVLIYPVSMNIEGSTPDEYIKALSSHPFIEMDHTTAMGLSNAVSKACARYNFTPKPAYECNDAFSIIGLVAAGLGWSIVPDLELSDTSKSGIGRVELEDRIVIGMSYRKSGLSEQTNNFITVVRSFLETKDTDE
jgi:LysR family transcriptional regulator, benzoate and cis,cis-muconate-responsive activator of ben and cat genes